MKLADFTFKICIFGESGVGKTTLTRRFITGNFESDIKNTLGAALHIKFLEMDKKRIVLQIWDFGGEDRFKFLLPAYSRGSFAGIFMCDITNKESLKKIPEWISVFKEGLDEDEKNNPILLVGGKLDLNNQRAIDIKDANSLAKKFNLLGYTECSAKTGEKVDEIFKSLVTIILNKK